MEFYIDNYGSRGRGRVFFAGFVNFLCLLGSPAAKSKKSKVRYGTSFLVFLQSSHYSNEESG